MLATFRGGVRLLLPLLLLPVLAACDKKEEEQKEPTVLSVSGPNSCSAVIKSLEFSVVCDIKWTASLEDADWAKIESTSPTPNGGGVTVSFNVNREAGDRTGALVITSGSKSFRKTFTQGGLDNFFMPRELHLAGTQESYLIFDSPYAWKAAIAEGADWIDLKATEGASGYARIPVVAKDPNENIGDRSGSLTVSIAGEDFSIPVVQSQTDIILADGKEVPFDYKGGEFTIHTQSNVSYKIEVSDSWVHHLETKALNQATECFSVDLNEGMNERKATIRFTPTGGNASTVTVSVVQEGRDPFLSITKPGCYGIDGKSYFLGHDGWNLSSRVQLADGTLEYRLLNRAGLSVLCVRGYDPAAEEGSTAHVSLTGWQKANKFMMKEFDVKVLGSDEDLLWLKGDGNIGFVIQK